jgi:two-component system NtrC family sensor kinase
LSDAAWGDQIRRCEIVEIADADAEWELPSLRELARLRGFRSLLFVPLLRDRTLIGIVSVTRVESGPFAALPVHLLQPFADQAVIAIENTRLFKQTKEALEGRCASRRFGRPA